MAPYFETTSKIKSLIIELRLSMQEMDSSLKEEMKNRRVGFRPYFGSFVQLESDFLREN